MADIITLAESMLVTGSAGTSVRQSITEAIDVSAYDSIDFQFALWSQNGGGNGIKVTILTSMQNKSDDASWVSAGQSATLSPASAPPDWESLRVPDTAGGLTLFRYIRYQIDLQASTTSATVSISGLARRG